MSQEDSNLANRIIYLKNPKEFVETPNRQRTQVAAVVKVQAA